MSTTKVSTELIEVRVRLKLTPLVFYTLQRMTAEQGRKKIGATIQYIVEKTLRK